MFNITVSAFADSNGVPGGGGPSCAGYADDTYATFSNFGPEVDIAAPGVCIRSTRTRGGTSVMTGLACLAYARAQKLARWAAASLSRDSVSRSLL